MTPRAFSSRLSELILLSAPRGLKEPVRWKSSHLRRASMARLERSGVRWMRPSRIARARSTSSLFGSGSATLAHRFEQEDGGGGRRVKAVGSPAVHGDRDEHVCGVPPTLVEALVLRADDQRG